MNPLAWVLLGHAGETLTPSLANDIVHEFHDALPDFVCTFAPDNVVQAPMYGDKRLVCNDRERVGLWVANRTGHEGGYSGGHQAIGALDDTLSRLVAGVVFEGISASNAMLHAAIEGKYALKRAFLWATYDYAFNVLDLDRVTSWVRESNAASLKYHEHLGYETEYVIRQGNGEENLISLVLWRDRCRWIHRRA